MSRRLAGIASLLVVGTVMAGCVGPTEEDGDGPASDESFTRTVLVTGMEAPYNILWGPDGALWITERVGKAIVRIDPQSGEELTSMPIPDAYQAAGQDGVMGMTFGPGFLEGGDDHLYVAYTYDADDGEALDRRTRLARFTYADGALHNETILIDGLAASVDHNSGRLARGPDGLLYYTIGDQGNNQFSRYCNEIQAQRLPTQEEIDAQDWISYQGKVLRLELDGGIPDDNPVLEGVRSHVYTYGHRNPQGLTFGPDGAPYVSEHMDKSDDEVNRLEPGGNYGWPHVSGYQDDQAYAYVNWSAADDCEDLTFTNIEEPPPGVPVQQESEFEKDFVPPVATFHTVESDHDFVDPACGDNVYVCWPTVAPSSLRHYAGDAIPGWQDTLLMTTLKGGRLFHLVLDESGRDLAEEPAELFRSDNRYRDVAFHPDGHTLYVLTDAGGPVQAVGGGASTELEHRGAVLVFTYTG